MKKVFLFLFLFLCTCVAPQYLSAAATIEGTVTDAVTGNPISGALVEAVRGGQVRYSDTTAPDGTYSLTEVQPSNYTLVVSAPGYQNLSIGVKADNNQTSIVDIQLIPIGGTIDGTVTDETTALPISGATIRIFQGTDLIQTTTTNGIGLYSAPNLAPGSYIVLASAPGYRTQFQRASVQVSTTTTVDFALALNPGTISGTVIDAFDASPIAGATVEVFNEFVLVGFADTDGSGNYTISGLAPGSYIVRADEEGFQSKIVGANVAAGTTTTVDFALDHDPGTIAGTVTDASTGKPIPSVSINVFDSTTLVASLLTDTNGQYNISVFAPGSYIVTANANTHSLQVKGATVTSNVTTVVNFSLSSDSGIISGTVTDAVTTNPIPNATLAVFQAGTLIDFALTDVNGNYIIPDLAPGDYTVLAIAQGYRAAFSAKTVVAGSTTIADFALNSHPGAIAGTVRDACAGGPVPGALILVTDGSTIVSFGLTTTDGNYSIDTLAPGNYTVAAGNQNFLTSSAPAAVTANATTIVNFTLTPAVFPPAIISGCVKKNEFLTNTDFIRVIAWTKSPSACVTGYQVFRNGKQIAFVPATSELEFEDGNRNKKTDVYSVKAVNSFGQVSDAISITLDHKSKCPKGGL